MLPGTSEPGARSVAITSHVDTPPLPSSLRQAVWIELGRASHAPYEAPIVVAVNGVLMTGLWF